MAPQATNDAAAPAVVVAPSDIQVPADVHRTAERLGILGQLPQVIALSRELFGDPIVLRVAEDPELEGWTHVVVQVVPKETIEETVAKEERWCDLMVERRLSCWFTLADE